MIKLKKPRMVREVLPCFCDLIGKLEDFFREYDKKAADADEKLSEISKIADLSAKLEDLRDEVSALADRVERIE